ncbi:hypothetical protein FQR65_LT18536 [Abscondita terminalis]|nr:hypothetical protein FQR65_LT18536 [Abscondita terminalis]
MYCVVKFEGHKCAIVALNWLSNNNTECFWPTPCSTDAAYIKKVMEMENPKKNWKKYKVIKFKKSYADYTEAESYLQKIIDESSSSDGVEKSVITHMDFNECAIEASQSFISENNENDCGTRKTTNSSDNVINNFSSSTDFSNDDEEEERRPSRVHSAPQSPSVFSVASGSARSEVSLLETILRRVEQLSAVQNQQTIILNSLLQANQSCSNQTLNKPEDFPVLPINSKPEYKALEEFLKVEDKFNYMVCTSITLLLGIQHEEVLGNSDQDLDLQNPDEDHDLNDHTYARKSNVDQFSNRHDHINAETRKLLALRKLQNQNLSKSKYFQYFTGIHLAQFEALYNFLDENVMPLLKYPRKNGTPTKNKFM